MTTRERREARAERLRGWAETRVERAAAEQAAEPDYIHDWAFITQPGHIPARARANRRQERRWESEAKAADMARRADGIERQLRESIYDDDPDAIEQLEAKLDRLTAQRDRVKAENAAFRKEHRAELKEFSAYDRDNAMPHRAYVTQNLTGNITRTRQRLEGLKRQKANPQAVVKNGRKGWYVKCPACQLPYMEGLTYKGAQALADAHNAEAH